MKKLLVRGLACCVAIVSSIGACSSSVAVTTNPMSGTDGAPVVLDAGVVADVPGATGMDVGVATRDASSDDGGPPADGGMCVDFGRPAFDTSCASDGECTSVFAGTLCPGYNCVCPAGRSIGPRDLPRYQTLASSVPRGAGPFCSCPALGRSYCVAGQCIWCANFASPGENPSGCRDGG